MTFFERTCKTLQDNGVEYAVVGGHAVALHGAVRGTVDVDFVVRWTQESLSLTENALLEIGLVSRLPINAQDAFNNREYYVNERNLFAWNFYNPKSIFEQVDIIINYDLRPETVDKIDTGSLEIAELRLESLIEMKQAVARPQDLQDIDALKRLQGEIE